MKKLLAIILMMLTLTGCSFVMMPKNDHVEMPKPEPEIVVEGAEEEVELKIEDPVEASMEVPAEEALGYESLMVDGLVEDTISFGFEIPVFDVPGGEKIGEYFDRVVRSMEDYTKEVVYEEAMGRSCIASVYGQVDSATLEDGIIAVEYSYICQYSDAEEPEVHTTTLCFDMQTGEVVK